MTGFTIERLGEEALLLRLGERIDDDTNRRVHALAAVIDARRPPWLCDIVPAYASLALFVDDDRSDPDDDPLQHAERWLQAQDLAAAGDRDPGHQPPLEIPVRYGGEHGPDLEAVAAHADITAEEVIALHTAGDYRVAMLGFAPGFPYLLGLDPRLAMPRMDTPRARIPAGSVAIGGAQTGIYPRESPGGWRILGRTPLVLFDPARPAPALLEPGRRVRFVAATDDEAA
ncbi:5-oxoprolinase subunit PxpB [Luteimonas suaedae]|uniref:5-oxoprolinase subunit PxpB n=1 Tax=Luteimonas suaedae TaxID=2605430 RepID=UPI0011EFC8CB|nr:5-oxoprolinase subunit PxpB [Luteimonas suaedae]